MAERDNDFGAVTRIAADAVGKPGQRAFRVLVESERGSACLWVEREQLQALAMLIEQLLSGYPAIQIQGARGASSTKRKPEGAFPATPDVDLRVGQLALGYDDRNSVYVLLARSVESANEQEADFTCQATRTQLRALSETIPPLLAAGRPRCPMCDVPLGGSKHHCERSNGHIRGLER